MKQDSQVVTVASLRTEADALALLMKYEGHRSDDALAVYWEILESGKDATGSSVSETYKAFLDGNGKIAGFHVRHFQDSGKTLAAYDTLRRYKWTSARDEDGNPVLKSRVSQLLVLKTSEARFQVKSILLEILEVPQVATIGKIRERLKKKWCFSSGVLGHLFLRQCHHPNATNRQVASGRSTRSNDSAITTVTSGFDGVIPFQNETAANALAFARHHGNIEGEAKSHGKIVDGKDALLDGKDALLEEKDKGIQVQTSLYQVQTSLYERLHISEQEKAGIQVKFLQSQLDEANEKAANAVAAVSATHSTFAMPVLLSLKALKAQQVDKRRAIELNYGQRNLVRLEQLELTKQMTELQQQQLVLQQQQQQQQLKLLDIKLEKAKAETEKQQLESTKQMTELQHEKIQLDEQLLQLDEDICTYDENVVCGTGSSTGTGTGSSTGTTNSSGGNDVNSKQQSRIAPLTKPRKSAAKSTAKAKRAIQAKPVQDFKSYLVALADSCPADEAASDWCTLKESGVMMPSLSTGKY